jgi:GT2 family glycosyltransferase
MPKVETRAPASEGGAERVKVPSVLVILVTRNGGPWLPQCLLALSKQSHPRIGVLAVDNDSSDGSADLLETALGSPRVIRLRTNAGFGGAVTAALRTDMAKQADYVLLMHDDTILSPDAVASLVETAEKIGGAGVIGPKILDWDDPRILQGIGLSTDRFGYPYSPLEAGEVDHGQYDRVREVRFLSTCAMLVSRSAWSTVGMPDERLGHGSEGLDFCWRAQVAGFHVLMTPNAVVRHRMVADRMERTGAKAEPFTGYRRERVALACILKNYGILSLLWVLPLYFLQGLARVVFLALSRRFEDASQVLAAWGWNVAHLPGTLRLRAQSQAARSVPDRSVRRSMAPTAIRIRQWAAAAAGTFLPAPEAEGAEPGMRSGVARFAVAHPVATAWIVAVALMLVAYRNVLFASPLSGGALAGFPATPTAFFRAFVSAIRSTGLGGTQAASPAVALLGVGSVAALGSPALLQKLLLVLLPAGGGVGCYRAVRSATGERIPSVVAAGCYALSGVVLGSFSQGRLPILILLAGLPWMVGKVSIAFEAAPRLSFERWVVGAGLGLGILASFYPGVALSTLLVAAGALVAAPGPRARLRGIWWVAAAAGLAALLALPVTLSTVRALGPALTDAAGAPSVAEALRLSLGLGPGAWLTAFYLPVSAALALVFVEGSAVRPAVRSAFTGLAGVYLAWAAGTGHLPSPFSSAPAYLGVAAFEFALLVGLGLAAVLPGVSRASFGRRHVGAGALVVVLAVGLGGQALQAGKGTWAVGENGVTPAYATVRQSAGPFFRVLWVGRPGNDPFPSPGGLPERTVSAGGASVRFAVTLPAGASALDFGRPASGPGYEALRQVVADILAGQTHHGGALLAPFGIRYVVADPLDLPALAARRLAGQFDLDVLPTTGMTILRNAKAVPLASVVTSEEWVTSWAAGGAVARSSLPLPQARSLSGAGQRYSGPAPGGPSLVLLSQQFDGGWRLSPANGGGPVRARRAFGWAVGFAPPPGAPSFTVHYQGQGLRTALVALLALLWLAALWMTRRPVRGR